MYDTESMFLLKIAIMYIQNHYFWLWWVDVCHRINVFGENINYVYTELEFACIYIYMPVSLGCRGYHGVWKF